MKLEYDRKTGFFTVEGVKKGSPEWQSLAPVMNRSRLSVWSNFLVAYQLARLIPVESRSEAAREAIGGLVAWRDRCLNARDGLHVKEEGFFQFQSKNGRLMEEAHSVMLCDKTGLGKTRSVLNGLQSVPPPHLIVCRKIAAPHWEKEIHAIDPDFAVLSLIDEPPARRRELLAPESVAKFDFVIVNYDILRFHSGYQAWAKSNVDKDGRPKWPGDEAARELNLIEWESVTYDEIHRLKNPKSVRTRAAWMVSRCAKRRYGLTATPVGNNLEDLWAQCRAIWPHEFDSLQRFRDSFLDWEKAHHGGVEVHGWTPAGRKLFDDCFGWRMTTRDYHDPDVKLDLQSFPEELPEEHIDIDLTSEEREQYDSMIDDWLAWDPDSDDPLVARSPLVAMNWARTIACGVPVITPQGEFTGLTRPSAKITELHEQLVDAACPTVVFADRTVPIDFAMRELTMKGHSVSYITGPVKSSERQARIDAFQEGKIDVLLCTVGAAGESITLTHAGLLIYLQDTWSLLDKVQTRGRVLRIGSESEVPVKVIRAKGTVDMAVTAALVEKSGWLDGLRQDKTSLEAVLRGEQ